MSISRRLLALTFVVGCVGAAGIAYAVSRHLDELVRPVVPEAIGSSDLNAPTLIHLRSLAKIAVVEDVTDGRLSLLSAAALFRELDRLPPAAVFPIVAPDPLLRLTSATPDELYCGWVIAHVRCTLSNTRPDLVETVTSRLVAEFEAEQVARGVVRLHDIPDPEVVRGLIERGSRYLHPTGRAVINRPPRVADRP